MAGQLKGLWVLCQKPEAKGGPCQGAQEKLGEHEAPGPAQTMLQWDPPVTHKPDGSPKTVWHQGLDAEDSGPKFSSVTAGCGRPSQTHGPAGAFLLKPAPALAGGQAFLKKHTQLHLKKLPTTQMHFLGGIIMPGSLSLGCWIRDQKRTDSYASSQ